ncbi:MAG: isocitrate lyase/phosphoenolpyruvate mutase family protein [Chloroflexota bacterium]|nr:isocitrate lyase/phosphoenolpyruvate mutase family protein [Chloroflexota bacterium]
MLDSEKREIFRKVLQGEECLFPGSVYDAVSARLATEVGFEIGMFAGSIGSSVVLGAPDYIVLTLTEFADQARRICRNTDLPLLVDADHGYGNALNVKRTVEELENAGVAALTIEDTDLPRPYGTQKPTLISIDEGIGKMKAALEGRSDSSLIIARRSSAFSVTSIEDAVERAKQYESAGVDAMFFAGISTREELSAARDAISIPIMLGSVSKELEDKDFLSSMGVKVALQGHLPYMAGVKAVYEVMKALRSGTKPSELGGASQYSDLISRVTRENEHDGWIDKYL